MFFDARAGFVIDIEGTFDVVHCEAGAQGNPFRRDDVAKLFALRAWTLT